MLFYIDKSITEYITKENDHILECLENLAKARRLGKHLITADRKTLEYLSKCNLINTRERDVYRKLYLGDRESRSLLNIISYLVHIVPEKGILEQSFDKERNLKTIKVSADIFVDFSILTETSLLVEDLNDAHIYKKIADYYCYQEKCNGISIKYRYLQGGGDRTAAVFEQSIESKNSLVLCICDTDKKAPNHRKGGTLRKVNSIDRNKKNYLCELFYGNYHEVENLIPAKLYKEMLSNEFNNSDNDLVACTDETLHLLGFINKSLEENFYDYLLYFDYKEGIKIKEFDDCNFKNYWTSILTKMSIMNEESCKNIEKIGSLSQTERDMTIIQGKKDILKKVYEYMMKYTLEEVENNYMCDYLKDEWRQVGKTIVSWCCGTTQIVQIG